MCLVFVFVFVFVVVTSECWLPFVCACCNLFCLLLHPIITALLTGSLLVDGWLPGTVGASSTPGARVSDCDCVGHREDLAGGRHEQRVRHAVGPSLPGKSMISVGVVMLLMLMLFLLNEKRSAAKTNLLLLSPCG